MPGAAQQSVDPAETPNNVESRHHTVPWYSRTPQQNLEVSMARYQPYNVSQIHTRLLPRPDIARPLRHALHELVDKRIDLTPFEARYGNGHAGRHAFQETRQKRRTAEGERLANKG